MDAAVLAAAAEDAAARASTIGGGNVDLAKLRLTVEDLERYGPTLILDHKDTRRLARPGLVAVAASDQRTSRRNFFIRVISVGGLDGHGAGGRGARLLRGRRGASIAAMPIFSIASGCTVARRRKRSAPISTTTTSPTARTVADARLAGQQRHLAEVAAGLDARDLARAPAPAPRSPRRRARRTSTALPRPAGRSSRRCRRPAAARRARSAWRSSGVSAANRSTSAEQALFVGVDLVAGIRLCPVALVLRPGSATGSRCRGAGTSSRSPSAPRRATARRRRSRRSRSARGR